MRRQRVTLEEHLADETLDGEDPAPPSRPDDHRGVRLSGSEPELGREVVDVDRLPAEDDDIRAPDLVNAVRAEVERLLDAVHRQAPREASGADDEKMSGRGQPGRVNRPRPHELERGTAWPGAYARRRVQEPVTRAREGRWHTASPRSTSWARARASGRSATRSA